MKILSLYDGSLDAQTALRWGIFRIRERGGLLTVLHVLNTDLFIGYDALPNAKDLARAESAVYRRLAERLLQEEASGLRTELITVEGNPETAALEYAAHSPSDLIVAAPRSRSLVYAAHCPVSLAPGYCLVPIDNTRSHETAVPVIATRAASARSKVILVGIVPVHLFALHEDDEVKLITSETGENLRAAAKALKAGGIESLEMLVSGYPDEELLKIAEKYPVTEIVFTAVGSEPSELNKLASIIQNATERPWMPVTLLS